ncbi:hypothetical protein SAMN05444673_2575 [Bacillus sp. OV166]|uniref:hypothetical protein n=1 Tax=Bacillus sp. OV166 TaxID=1882763 RepID=UPI000A2AE0B9|nr:hypothetical protein [Bacillus sp. OV166]SMQ75937.1 hypothetical protein SAMN05444673_2575 [Bacillus sp. OV166]
MDDKLSLKEKLEITVQTGLQLIPYVGGALSTAYFSTKQEKRFKRVESYYIETADKINQLQLQLPPINIHDEDSLTSLIEHLNDKIEKEHSDKKREYFKNFFINMLRTPTLENNYDERRIFLEALSDITILEFNVLLSFSEEHKAKTILNNDDDVIVGAKSRLEMFGFLEGQYMSFLGGTTVKSLLITPFGKKFINFCLE